MPSRTQDKIYETFAAVAGSQVSSQHSMIDASERIAKPGAHTGAQIRTAKPVTWRAASTTTPSKAASTSGAGGATDAQSVASSVMQNVLQNVPLASAVAGATSPASGGGIGNTIESIASTVLKSGLGMAPLIGGLLGLFGGGDSPAPAALTKYAMPASIAFEGADVASGIGGFDYDQMGVPRAYSGGGNMAPQAGLTSLTGSGGGSAGVAPVIAGGSGSTGPTPATASSGSSSGGNGSAPQITVNVQAMDARSFLDRSSDIAAAVREAMLNLSSINDVVNEL
jgi:hypothetical protein